MLKVFMVILAAVLSHLSVAEDLAAPGVVVVRVPLTEGGREQHDQSQLMIYEMPASFCANGKINLAQIQAEVRAHESFSSVISLAEFALEGQSDVPSAVRQEFDQAEGEQDESLLFASAWPLRWRVWAPYGVYANAGFYGFGYGPYYNRLPYYPRYRYYDGRYHYPYYPAHFHPYRYNGANHYYYYHRPGIYW